MGQIHDKMEIDVIELMMSREPCLHESIKSAKIIKREYTGVGFFTYYDNVIIETETTMTGVGAKLNRTIEVGFVLFIKKGHIILEGFTYGDCWPTEIASYEIYST